MPVTTSSHSVSKAVENDFQRINRNLFESLIDAAPKYGLTDASMLILKNEFISFEKLFEYLFFYLVCKKCFRDLFYEVFITKQNDETFKLNLCELTNQEFNLINRRSLVNKNLKNHAEENFSHQKCFSTGFFTCYDINDGILEKKENLVSEVLKKICQRLSYIKKHNLEDENDVNCIIRFGFYGRFIKVEEEPARSEKSLACQFNNDSLNLEKTLELIDDLFVFSQKNKGKYYKII